MKEVFNAPKRRVDNEISRLHESTNALLMHCRILDNIVHDYNTRVWNIRLRILLCYGASVGVTVGMCYLLNWLDSLDSSSESVTKEEVNVHDMVIPVDETVAKSSADSAFKSRMLSWWYAAPPASPSPPPLLSPSDLAPPTSSNIAEVLPPSATVFSRIRSLLSRYRTTDFITVATSILSLTTSTVYTVYQHSKLAHFLASFNQKSTYDTIFSKLYFKEIQSNDQFHCNLGNSVIDQMMNNINSSIIPTLPFVKKTDIAGLERIINEDIAELRRRASPNFPIIESRVSSNRDPTPPPAASPDDGELIDRSPSSLSSSILTISAKEDVTKSDDGDLERGVDGRDQNDSF
jgi:hypothetical protein